MSERGRERRQRAREGKVQDTNYGLLGSSGNRRWNIGAMSGGRRERHNTELVKANGLKREDLEYGRSRCRGYISTGK